MRDSFKDNRELRPSLVVLSMAIKSNEIASHFILLFDIRFVDIIILFSFNFLLDFYFTFFIWLFKILIFIFHFVPLTIFSHIPRQAGSKGGVYIRAPT